jgi:ferric-dicitrate binding protein FerR (iron transport regulator)
MEAEKIDYLIGKILSGSATALEKEDFEKWLYKSDQNKAYYEEIKVLWEKLEGTYNKVEFDKTAAKETIRLKIIGKQKNNQKRIRRYWFAAAASVILMIGLGFLFNNYKSFSGNPIVYSTTNFVEEIILADSSHVWLNANSTLQVPNIFLKKQRKVFLKGEAYFEIAKDEAKPFKVLTGNTVTEVLGTTFNINMDTLSGNVSVIVNSGEVAFYEVGQTSEKSVLNPNDNGQYLESSRKILISSNKNQNFLSWKTGILTFSDTPLEEVCKVLSRHYKKIVKVSDNISGESITGSFRNEKLEDILKTIEITFDVQISTGENEIIIYN